MSRSLAIAMIAVAAIAPLVKAQQSALTCVSSAQPPLVRLEGVSERVGDIVFDCSGGMPNSQVLLNFTLFLNVNITNRINAANQTDAFITANLGDGPVTMNTPGVLVDPARIAFDGVPVPFSSTGAVQIRISGLRGNATQVAPASPFIYATLSIGGSTVLAVNNPVLQVAQAVPGLYSSEVGTVACNQKGSSAVATPSFAAFVAHGTSVDTIRVTEGFAYALAPKSDLQNLHADTGTRILVQYSGAPSGTVFYIPDVVAGTNATEATSVGAYGVAVSGGKYNPALNGGSLLLARVYGADANGIGGTPVYTPGAPGSGTVSFDKLGAVPTSNGSAYAVYEVVDARNNARESAQIPVFVTFPPIYDGLTYNVINQVSLAPVSNVAQASRTAPIPRFTGAVAGSDCPILGDCTVPTTPAIRSITSSANFTPGTVVPGSLATVMGNNLDGTEVIVAFDGVPAKMLYGDRRQINVMVPEEVSGLRRTQVLVRVDGRNVYQVVPLQPFSPGVFPGAVLNQDNSLNSPATPARTGSVIQIWGTGIAPNGVVTAIMGGQPVGEAAWWGPAPGIPGVQQVNLRIPEGLQFTDNTTTFSICEASAAAPDHKLCSPAQPLNVSR